MNSKAQSGLEYLMTYGWALVLLTAVIGILIFIVGSPGQNATFSSSDPTKILISAGAIQGITTTVVLKNITGGSIVITNISPTGTNYSTCTINESSPDISIAAGGTMDLECPLSGEDPTGAVGITYEDFADIERSVIIRINGGTGAAVSPPGGGGCESGGSGTSGDPFILTTIAEVQAIPDSSTSYYELCQDIDASATSGWNGGLGFVPLTNFQGHFYGNGYKITGLSINRAETSTIGLFGSVSSPGEIVNLGLQSVSISGYNVVGALIGVNTGFVTKCYSTGTVTGGNVALGGLVGSNTGTITNSYSTATVAGYAYVGGLVGINSDDITNSYSAGPVSGTLAVGGLVGDSGMGVCTNSYWDLDTSGQGASGCGTGELTAQMKQQATFTGWDFSTIWNIDEGVTYPFLR